jgi:hypothetical protein
MATMVVIKCPETDREIATGIITDVKRFSRLGDGHAATHCPHCDQQHHWSRRDAFLSVTFKAAKRK